MPARSPFVIPRQPMSSFTLRPSLGGVGAYLQLLVLLLVVLFSPAFGLAQSTLREVDRTPPDGVGTGDNMGLIDQQSGTLRSFLHAKCKRKRSYTSHTSMR